MAITLVIIGAGTMGEALIKGIQASELAKQYRLTASRRSPQPGR